MTRQAFTRVLLSLLLLITQQMAASHAMSHWGAMLGAGQAQGQTQTLGQVQQQAREHRADGGESELSRAFALDQTCDQCLAFAQLAAPLGNTPRAFAPPDLAAAAIASAASQPACARTVCAFRSRAPPQA